MDHDIVIKPWGFYRVLSRADNRIEKQLVINPRGQLSLQRHEHRDELWTVLHGKGLLSLAGQTKVVTRGDTVEIKKHSFHRIKNISDDELLAIHEIQTGDLLSEDDITRIEDDYGRV